MACITSSSTDKEDHAWVLWSAIEAYHIQQGTRLRHKAWMLLFSVCNVAVDDSSNYWLGSVAVNAGLNPGLAYLFSSYM
jgi:hypothetical protein